MRRVFLTALKSILPGEALYISEDRFDTEFEEYCVSFYAYHEEQVLQGLAGQLQIIKEGMPEKAIVMWRRVPEISQKSPGVWKGFFRVAIAAKNET